MACLDEDIGDQEPGKDEEQIHSGPAKLHGASQSAGVQPGRAEVEDHDRQNRDAAKSVER
jgi:hypothetical protein